MDAPPSPWSEDHLNVWLKLHDIAPERAEAILNDIQFHESHFFLSPAPEFEEEREAFWQRKAEAMHRLQWLGLLPLHPPRPWSASEDDVRYAMSKRMGFSWV